MAYLIAVCIINNACNVSLEEWHRYEEQKQMAVRRSQSIRVIYIRACWCFIPENASYIPHVQNLLEALTQKRVPAAYTTTGQNPHMRYPRALSSCVWDTALPKSARIRECILRWVSSRFAHNRRQGTHRAACSASASSSSRPYPLLPPGARTQHGALPVLVRRKDPPETKTGCL